MKGWSPLPALRCVEDAMKDAAQAWLASGLVAYLAGGVVAGMVWCKDCEGWSGNTLGRLFIGIVMGVLSAVRGGFPPRDMGGTSPPLNAWPYIIGCWIVLFTAAMLWARLRRR